MFVSFSVLNFNPERITLLNSRYIYACMYMCLCACVCVYIYIYTYYVYVCVRMYDHAFMVHAYAVL